MSDNVSPLLKWPGGKRNLLKHILPLIPEKYGRYYEPFFGGGALFFSLQPMKGTISDNNKNLIECYQQIKENPEQVIKVLQKYKNSENEYYEIRNEVPKDAISRSARLIYLATLSFNGLYRLNLKGEFNVPYSYKKHLNPCNIDKILKISLILSKVTIRNMDFEAATNRTQKGDLIYFDPPYTVAHGNNGFIKYNSKIFSWDDQKRLAEQAYKLSSIGCNVIISNAYHSSILELYHDFKLKIIDRYSIIASKSRFRREIKECIFYNGE